MAGTAEGQAVATSNLAHRRDHNSDLTHQERKPRTDKPMMEVKRLPPGPVCHVADVDAQANRDDNELAADSAADEISGGGFQCGKRRG